MVNCLLLTLMWNRLCCNAGGGVKRLTEDGIVALNAICFFARQVHNAVNGRIQSS